MQKYAFDKSLRTIDADGRMHVKNSHISKAVVNPYYGKEIPGYEQLGLDANRVYMLFRDPRELAKGASTFANLPILKEHTPVNAEDTRPDLTVGTIGSNVSFDNPYLNADLCIWDAEAIKDIESGKTRELSCAYRYVPVMEPGRHMGEAYDGRMTQIEGNHLALVENGRAGSDVVVADHNPFREKEKEMQMTKLGRALYVALKAASPKLAQDAALGGVVGKVKGVKDAKGVKAKIHAMDGDIPPERADEIIDAVLGIKEPEGTQAAAGVADEDPAAVTPETNPDPMEATDEDDSHEKVRKMLEGKVPPEVIEEICKMLPAPAEDEFPEGKKPEEKEELKGEKEAPMKREEVKGAMDSLERKLRAQYKALERAKDAVREVTGPIMGMDTAEEVYKHALKQLGVDYAGVTDGVALEKLTKVAMAGRKSAAPISRVAMDAEITKSLPGLERFGRV